MSGGHFNYDNDRLCNEIFDYTVSADYGAYGFNQSKIARRINPFEDLLISELVFDVFCLLHSYDWYKSGDTCEETYRKDVKHFKDKWLTQLPEYRAREIIEDEISNLREELYLTFNINNDGSEDDNEVRQISP